MNSRALTQSSSDNCQELAEVGRNNAENELKGDTPLFRALVSGCHVENAAAIAGVSERTVYRRLADPEFRKQIDEARKALRESILAKLCDAGHDAISSLTDLMHSAEDEMVRLKAAKAVLDSLLTFQRSEAERAKTPSIRNQPEYGEVVVYLPKNIGDSIVDSPSLAGKVIG